MLLIESIRGGICHAIYRYAKANIKCVKDHDKSRQLPYVKYWDVNNLYV